MTNKSLALLGVGAYALSVLASASDLNGNPTAPIALIVISGIATILFIIMATIRLWREMRIISIVLVLSIIILFISGILPNIGNTFILICNVIKLISFVVYFWTILILWSMDKYKRNDEKPTSVSRANI